MVKNPPTMQETWVWFLGQEDPLEKEMAPHSSIGAWRIPMDRGAVWAAVHGIAESDTTEQLKFLKCLCTWIPVTLKSWLVSLLESILLCFFTLQWVLFWKVVYESKLGLISYKNQMATKHLSADSTCFPAPFDHLTLQDDTLKIYVNKN